MAELSPAAASEASFQAETTKVQLAFPEALQGQDLIVGRQWVLHQGSA